MSARPAIFLDANAGLPLPSEIHQALFELLRPGAEKNAGASVINEQRRRPEIDVPAFANPSSIHLAGRNTRREVELARSRVATSLGLSLTQAQSVSFTSSGTAANAVVIGSALGLTPGAANRKKARWVVTTVEHASVRDWIPLAREAGVEVVEVGVDSRGLVHIDEWKQALATGADLATLLWVNNESGVIQELAPLLAAARDSQTPTHVDAAQAWGKLPIHFNELSADFLTLSGHKIGAWTGIGAIVARPGMRLRPIIPGSQEHGIFGGTENVFGIVSLGLASERVPEMIAAQQELEKSRNLLQDRIQEKIAGTHVHGEGAPRVAGTLQLGFRGLSRPGLVAALDLEGVQVSAGAACSSGTEQPSAVLLAMGKTPAEARSSIRISLPQPLSSDELNWVLQALERSLARLRQFEVNGDSKKEQTQLNGQ